MTQAQIDRAVARATGESLNTIRTLGFSLSHESTPCHDPDPLAPPQIVDWDRLAAERLVFFPILLHRAAAA